MIKVRKTGRPGNGAVFANIAAQFIDFLKPHRATRRLPKRRNVRVDLRHSLQQLAAICPRCEILGNYFLPGTPARALQGAPQRIIG